MTVTSCMAAPVSPTTIFVNAQISSRAVAARQPRSCETPPPCPRTTASASSRSRRAPPRSSSCATAPPRPPSPASRSRCSTATATRRSRPRARPRPRRSPSGSRARSSRRCSSRRCSGRTRPPRRSAERTGLEPVVVPDLREVSLGEWEGGEFRIRMARGRPDRAAGGRRGALGRDPGRRDDGVARASACAPGSRRSSRRRRPTSRVAAIVHGGVIGEVCRQATDSRPFAFVHADNGSITRL